MVGTANVQPTIGVTDLAVSAAFYGGILGLTLDKENIHEVIYKSGNDRLSIYATPSAGTNESTYATWEVTDIGAEIEELKSKGVEFEHYDMEGATLEGDVHVMGNEKAAWFKDPDGNILCLHTVSQ